VSSFSVDIWSDIACPWCYVGKRRIESALQTFPLRSQVEITWHAFELDPGAPREKAPTVPYAERLAKKYGSSVEHAERLISRLRGIARTAGLELDFERIRPGNTFDAHRLIHLAKLRGNQDAMKERLLRAYLSEGKAIAEPQVLLELASDVGLDVDEVSGVLASDLYADAVRADEAQAQRLGIQGVPFFVFDGRLAVSGAQLIEVFSRVLEQAFDESEPPVVEEGAVCGPDGCP
jgi:predicted DsbA family dithiol-disulfide isomerase